MGLQIFDEHGIDVTPLPLLQLDPHLVRQKQSHLLTESSAGTVKITTFVKPCKNI